MSGPVIRRVVVGVSGTLSNLAVLHAAADVARRCDVELVAVHAGTAVDVIDKAILDAFGGPPAGIALTAVTASGSVGDALVRVASHDDDVLVVGSGRPRRLPRARSVSRYCAANARCVVLTVPPPPLIRQLPGADMTVA